MAPRTRSSKRVHISSPIPELDHAKPSKRPRLHPPKATVEETQTNVPLTELSKHSELWLSDGNIVLAAGHACFKLHRSQLARFCTVFEDMLGAPSGGPEEEIMEDCVVVRMPDAVADLTNFLEALYNGCSFDFDTDKAANFPAVSGVMRLATKYDCQVLRTRILSTLRKRYPSRLGLMHGFHGLFGTPHHAQIIVLARECDLLELLPSCFYQLAFCTGAMAALTDPLGLLAPADRTRLKEGKTAVLRRVAGLLAEGVPDTAAWCQNANAAPRTAGRKVGRRSRRVSVKSKCAAFLDKYWEDEVDAGGDILTSVVSKEPLRELSRLSFPRVGGGRILDFEPDEDTQPLCRGCRSVFRQRMETIISVVWDNLSVDFML